MERQAMPDILARIVARRREAVERWPPAPIPGAAHATPRQPIISAFLEALASRRGEAVIAEIKLGSPRLGDLSDRVDPERLAENYARNGAAALSVVVESEHFHGSYRLLERCVAASGLPALAKDFVVDDRQLDRAAAVGAGAVLLIASLQPAAELARLGAAARVRGLTPLVEVHTEEDIEKLRGADWELVGFNHRDLHDFTVDLRRSEPYLSRLPASAIKVAESGIVGRADLVRLRDAGFDAFLVGESLVTAADPAAALRQLTGGVGVR